MNKFENSNNTFSVFKTKEWADKCEQDLGFRVGTEYYQMQGEQRILIGLEITERSNKSDHIISESIKILLNEKSRYKNHTECMLDEYIKYKKASH